LRRVKRAALLIVAALAVAVAVTSASGATTTKPGLAYGTGTATGTPQVWLGDANGGHARKLGPGYQPLLSPNGQLVAATGVSAKGPLLLIYSASGKVVGKFYKAAKFSVVPIAWSPDSRYLAVEQFDPVSKGIGKSGLAVIDTSTGKTVTIARGFIEGASFSPTADTVVYGFAKSDVVSTADNLFSAAVNGTGKPAQLTHDGHSLNPIWGKGGILFDRERARKLAPRYDIFLLSGGHSQQITNVTPDQLSEGLVPLAVSADGSRLAAEFVGQDNSQGWAVNVATRHATELATPVNGLQDTGILKDGKRILVDVGEFMNPPSSGRVETVPFSGGPATVLVKHAGSPSWNQ
jgi:Tol biopolymer transport system component